MKRFLAVIFSAVVLSVSAFAITGCGCSNNDTSQEPETEIVGDWGGRSDDIEVEFNDDGTCIIGGVTGTYEIDENNTLTVTPNSDEESESEPIVFEYYNGNNTSEMQQNQWTVSDNKLYINGQQYNSTDNSASTNSGSSLVDNQSSASDNSSSNNSSSAVSSNGGSSGSTNSSSSSNSSGSSNSSNSSSSSNSSNSSSSSSSSDSSSSSSSSDSSNSSSSSVETEILQDVEETDVVNIVENLDDF